MNRTYCGVILAFALCLTGAAQSSRSEFEERFRATVGHNDDDINADVPGRVPPKENRLLEMAREAGVSRSEVQALLLRLVDQGMEARGDGEDAWQIRGLAKSALSVLGDLADVTMIDRLLRIAEQAPAELRSDSLIGVIETTNRVAPEKLPLVMHRLVVEKGFEGAYPILSDAVRSYRRAAPDDTERIAFLVQIFKEGLRNPNSNDRIYLDSVIEEYDPGFRQSEERKRILQELSNSDNPIVKRYAEDKLKAFGRALGTVNSSNDAAGQTRSSAESDPEKKTEAKTRGDELQAEKPGMRLWLWGGGLVALSIAALTMLWNKHR